MKQEVLAMEMGVTQQAISKIEQSETVEEETLEKVAKVLGVSPEAIEAFSEEAIIYNVQNNYEGSNREAANVSVTNYQCQFNPIEKIVELYDEKVALMERLLASEKEKVEMLRKGK